VSREALSLDISRVVSRVVSGEPIDTAENGAALAAKYPDLGMSAKLISQAIERAAGMVGMIKSAPEPVKPPRLTVAIPAPKSQPTTNGNGHSVAAKTTEPVTARKADAPRVVVPVMPVTTIPVSVLSIEDDLAAAIDAEIGHLVSGQRAKPAPVSTPVSDTPTPLIQAAAAPLVTAAALPKATVETRIGLATEEPQPADASPPDSPPAADSSAPKGDEQRGSIFSSFRRALFRS
jgi:hypothetical protein